MSLFGTILNKLGIGKKDEEEKAAPAKSSAPSRARSSSDVSKTVNKYVSRSTKMPMVDVVTKLEGFAKANPQELNWKTSIVDLLKLLDIDSDFNSRKELAEELHCPDSMMADSAKMNTWLHKAVLIRIAKNGGNIPQNLLD